MPHKLNIALLYGGNSGEHEVSLQSAASVFHALDKEKYNVIPIAIDKTGNLFVHEAKALESYKDTLPVYLDSARAIPSLIENGRFILDVQCVFPAIHGSLYEDGCLQGILETANVAYVGCDVLSSAVGMDKDITRQLVCKEDLHCARYSLIQWHMSPEQKSRVIEHIAALCGFPLFVKPCSLGSSVGIQKIHSISEALSAVNNALNYDKAVLIEEFINGREIEVAILENRQLNLAPKSSIPGEIRITHEDGFYSYNAKYINSNKSELIIPAELQEDIIQSIQQKALMVFTRLKCRGMARVDFFVHKETNEIFFNEINTLPGFTPISMYPKLWQASGLTYSNLLDELIELALSHHAARLQRITSYL